MTDREMLDLILAKVTTLDSDMQNVKTDIQDMKTGIKETKSDITEMKTDIKEMKEMDKDILNEVERVHEIFEKKYDELNRKIS